MGRQIILKYNAIFKILYIYKSFTTLCTSSAQKKNNNKYGRTKLTICHKSENSFLQELEYQYIYEARDGTYDEQFEQNKSKQYFLDNFLAQEKLLSLLQPKWSTKKKL